MPETYLVSTGKAKDYFEKIQRGTAPERFTNEYIEGLGFKSKNDRALIGVLKSLGFLTEANVPTQAYRDYLDPKRGRVVLGRAILGAYQGLFEFERDAHKSGPSELSGKFKSLANASDSVADKMASTFTNLCSIADIDRARSGNGSVPVEQIEPVRKETVEPGGADGARVTLNYTIEINLPNTTNLEVFRAIFKALKEHISS